jgi:hypothetical protein
MFASPKKSQKKSAQKIGALAGARGLVKYLSLDDGGGKHFGNLVSDTVMSLLPQSTTTKGRA